MTLEEERKLGQEAFEEVSAQLKFVDDPDCLAYLRGLGGRLVEQIPDSLFTYRFYIADSPELNAFAIPGGYIVFNRGMIAALGSEAELAGVLAHEISHVQLRHMANRMDKATPLTVATLAGALLGIALATTGVGALGQAVMMGSVAGGTQALLSFSREDESQADYNGYLLLTGLGYPGGEMALSFQRIWDQERLRGGGTPTYLRSHPTSPERMERIEDMARRNPRPAKHYDNSEFLRIKARLEALYDPAEEVLRRLKTRHEDDRRAPLPIYGLALAQMRQGRYDLALAYLELLGRIWTKSPLVWREQAKCHLLTGEYAQARELYARATFSRPEDLDALSGLAQAYMRTDQLEQARQTLVRLVGLDPEADQALYDLGVVLAKQGRTAEGSLYLGRAFFKRSNYRTARFHLAKAVAGLTEQPELLRQAQEDMERLEEKTDASKKKKAEEEKKRQEDKRRQEEEDRRRSGSPPWGVSRP
jgi:predicted Zn-dependent protease